MGARARVLLPPLPTLAVWAVTRYLLLAQLIDFKTRDGVMDLTLMWVQELLAGANPYAVPGLAYPPAAMFSFVLFGGDSALDTYRTTFAYSIVLIDFAGLLVAWWAERSGRRHAAIAYVASIPLMGPVLLLWRYDLIPAVLGLAALVCVLRDMRNGAWLLLGVGIAFKPYLAVLVPLWAIWEWSAGRPGRGARLARCAALLVAPSLIAAVAMLPFAGLDFRSAYSSQVSRDFTQDSTPAVVMAELSKAGVGDQRAVFSQECLCFVRRGSAVPALRLAFNALLLAGLALLAYALARGQADGERLVIASAAALLLLVLTYPVYSPQYMLWLIPALVLLVGDRNGAVALGLVMIATALAAYSYPLHYLALIEYDPLGRRILIARTLEHAAALALLAGWLWRSRVAPMATMARGAPSRR